MALRSTSEHDGDAAGDAAEARALHLVVEATEALRVRDHELRRLQQLLEHVLEVCPPLVVAEDGVVRAWSAALEPLSGIRADEAMGRRLGRILPGLGELAERLPDEDDAWCDRGGRAWRPTVLEREGTLVSVVLHPETHPGPGQR
ncbi:MAG: hypothetical protein ABWZ76_11755 [Acidimicrobiales bacterium]